GATARPGTCIRWISLVCSRARLQPSRPPVASAEPDLHESKPKNLPDTNIRLTSSADRLSPKWSAWVLCYQDKSKSLKRLDGKSYWTRKRWAELRCWAEL